MPAFRARITSKGQVTIPVEVRRLLGLRTGDQITFDVEPGGVRVRPERDRRTFAAAIGRWRTGEGVQPAATDAWLRRIRGHDDG